MNRVLWNILFFIALSITVVFFAVGIYEYIAGPTAVARLLKRMHIPFGYTFVLFDSWLNLLPRCATSVFVS